MESKSNPAPANITTPKRLGSATSKSLGRACESILAGIAKKPELTPAQLEREREAEAERNRQQIARERHLALNAFHAQRGKRYAQCTIENFEIATDAAGEVVANLKRYLSNRDQHIPAGDGLLLYGPPGTGKDHLLSGAITSAIVGGFNVDWRNGADLYGANRDRISDGGREKEAIDRLVEPQILALSDPLPIRGDLTDFQATFLFRVLDQRYSAMKPTWATLNVASYAELSQRLGPQNAERLKDGAMAMFCNWPSYRKSLRERERHES